MVDFISHVIGICPDGHIHFDLMDFFLMGANELAFHARYFAYQVQNFLKLWV